MSNGIKSVRKPTTSRLDPQIKKLQKILEDPKTDRDTTIATRKELKKLKASVKKNPMSAMRKGIKPRPNVAAEKKKALLDIKNGSGKAPGPKPEGSGIAAKAAAREKKIQDQRKKEKAAKPKPKVVKKAPSKRVVSPRPAPPSNRGGRAINDPRFKKAVAKQNQKRMSGLDMKALGRTPTKAPAPPRRVARPVAAASTPRRVARPSGTGPSLGLLKTRGPSLGAVKKGPSVGGRRVQTGPTRKPAHIRLAGEMAEQDKRARGVSTQQNIDRVLKEKAREDQRAKGLSERQTLAGVVGDLERVKGRKQPVRKSIKPRDYGIDDAGIRTLVDAADAGTRFKKKPKESIFGFKQISGPKDWSTGKREYETPFGNIKVDSTPYEETLSEQEREQKEAEGVLKKGGKIGKKKKKVSKKKQGYKARKDESIAMRVKKKRTKKKLKASRDESYGKWGSKKGKGKINRSSGSALVASLYD